MTADPVRLIEAGYEHVSDEGEWLTKLVEDGRAYDQGDGVVVCTIDMGKRARVRKIATSNGNAEAAKSIRTFVKGLEPEVSRHVLAPTEFVGNAAYRLDRLCKAMSFTMPASLPPMWALVSGNGRDRALLMAFLGSPRRFAPSHRFPHKDRRLLGLVGAHWSSALRLRDAADHAPSQETSDAVLAPNGRVLDAKENATSKAARASLSEAVLRTERARGKLRRADATEATNLWQALVDGQWSIVEIVERDGKRLLLARANAPKGIDRMALTKDENDVVWLFSLGHSYKYVAYELGLSMTAVVRRLESAMKKLGVRTRADLLRKLAR